MSEIVTLILPAIEVKLSAEHAEAIRRLAEQRGETAVDCVIGLLSEDNYMSAMLAARMAAAKMQGYNFAAMRKAAGN